MHKINADEQAQATWAADVRRFHPNAQLRVKDVAGRWHMLISIGPADTSCHPFEGQAAIINMAGSGPSTDWPCSGSLPESLHLRVDDRGQLEAWDGSIAVAKIFDPDASPTEWRDRLGHAEASTVRDLAALLGHEGATTLKSLDLGRSQKMKDLRPVARLKQLQALALNSCSAIVDFSPLATLRQITSLNLSGCKHLADLAPLEEMSKLTSLDISGCKRLTHIGTVAGLKQLLALNLSDASNLVDFEPLVALENLTNLNVSKCGNFHDLNFLQGMNKLQKLNIGGCGEISDLNELKGFQQLRSLDAGNNDLISNIAPLADLHLLTNLNLSSISSLVDLEPLGQLVSLERLNLSGLDKIKHVEPLRQLVSLQSLNLEMCQRLSDLRGLEALINLKELNLGYSENISNLLPLAPLAYLKELSIGGSPSLTNISAISRLEDLTTLKIWGCDNLVDIAPVSSLTKLKELEIVNCQRLSAINPISTLLGLANLNLSNNGDLEDISPIQELTALEELNLYGCEKIVDLGPITGLARLKTLVVAGLSNLTSLDGLDTLAELRSLDLSSNASLTDLEPIAELPCLEKLDLYSCSQLMDISPLCDLPSLRTLDLSSCESLGVLRMRGSGFKSLASIELAGCSRLTIVGSIASAPVLRTIALDDCPNVRDADALADLQALQELSFDETATSDSVLLACCTRRGDLDLPARLSSAAQSFELSKDPILHSARMVVAVQALRNHSDDQTETFHAVAAACRARGEVPLRTWEALFGGLVMAPDPHFRPAFEAALTDLPLTEAERVLGPALLALADAPAAASGWALSLVQQALQPVAAAARHAREVAPAAAVFFHSQGQAAEVERWMDLGSVAQLPEWRDRVLLALIHRALQRSAQNAGELLEARRLVGQLQTPERRDEARAALVQHLAALAQFRAAATELDAIVDRAYRASAAAQALADVPAFVSEPNAGLSLLLALDGDPDTLADVLASMVEQAPDSPLVQQLAAVFAPNEGVPLGMTIDALLGHPAVAEVTKPNHLTALRNRVRSTPALAHSALSRGTVALLVSEQLIDNDEAAEVITALLGSTP